jgi:hypothetical protein
MLEIIAIVFALLAGTNWLLSVLAKRPDGGFRGISMGCGLFLAVGMTVMFIQAVTDPKEEFMAALVIVPWIALGVMLIAKAVKKQ